MNEAPRHHLNKQLDNIPDGSTYGRPILSRLSGGKPLIDFSEAIHLNKNQDNIGDGATYARVLATALTGNAIDPTKPGVLTKGSMPPSWSNAIAYTATTSSITIYWDGTNGSSTITIYRSDGTTAGPLSGNQAITGLTAGTTYYFYPYYDEASGTFKFVAGGTGTPAYAQTSRTPTLGQSQGLRGQIPLTSGAFTASTTVSGTGGGGGGGGVCLREGTLVETRTRGIALVEDVEIGEEIRSRTDWTRVVGKTIGESSVFIRITTDGNHTIEVTPTHIFTLADSDAPCAAQDLSLSRLMILREGYGRIVSIEAINTRARKATLQCAPYHEFFAGEDSPAILTHNLNALC